MFPVWKAYFEKAVPKQSAEVDTVQYTEHVTFSFSARVPRANLHSRNNSRENADGTIRCFLFTCRRSKKVFKNLTASNPQRECELESPVFEWVDYSAPLVCLEEEEDGACLREEPAPCSEDPHALVCSIDTRQLPQKRKRRPWVSLVIDDMGVDTWASERALRLRPAVTLSYLPYGPQVRQQARAAAAAGHELMVHLPMEPFNKAADAGPNALHSSMTPQQLQEHLHWALSQFDGYVGLNNHMGSLFTSRSMGGMTVVLEELRKRDLFFLDSLTATDSLGQELAAHLGTTFGARDVFLDSQRGAVPAVVERLQEVEQLAHKNGHAIAIGHPYDETLEALEKWLPLLHSKGLVLMPLKKALLRERKEQERAAGEAVLAVTRAKQLRSIQIQHERAWQERRAKRVAAELEAAFADGTVLAWQGLQEAGVEQALRAALARQRLPSGSLKASLQRLLAAPFWGGKAGEREDRSAIVETAAARLLRRRGHPGKLPDLVATQVRGPRAHALPHSKLPDKVRPRRASVGGRARGGRDFVDSSLPWAGPMLAGVEHAAPEEGASGGSFLKGAGSASHLGGVAGDGSGAALEWRTRLPGHPLRSTMGEDSKEAAADLRRGVLVAVVLQHTRGGLIAPEGGTDPGGCCWQGGVGPTGGGEEPVAARQRGGEASERAMQRWLAQLGTGQLSAGSSPRTVIVPERLEGPAATSSPDESPLGSRSPSLSSSDVSTRGAARAVLEECSSPGRSSTSGDGPSSLADDGAAEEARPAGGALWEGALQSASTVAGALAVAMHLAAHAPREAASHSPVLTAATEGAEHLLGPGELEGGVLAKKAGRCSGRRLEVRPMGKSVAAAVPASSTAYPPVQVDVLAGAGKEEVPPCTVPGAAADGMAVSLARPMCTALVARNSRTSQAPEEFAQGRPPLVLTPVVATHEEPKLPQTDGPRFRTGWQPAAGPGGSPTDGLKPPGLLKQTDHAGPELRPALLAAPGAQRQEGTRVATSVEPAVLVAPGQHGGAEQGAAPPERTLPGAADGAGAPRGTREAHQKEPGSPAPSDTLSAEMAWCDTVADPVAPASSLSSCATSGVQGPLSRWPLEAGGSVQPVQQEYASARAESADALRAPSGSAAAGAVSQASTAVGRSSGEGACSMAGGAGAGGQGKVEAEQSKKYGWWRWTVGCVLGGFEDAETGESGDRVLPAALHGKRRVVPLDMDDPQ